MGRRFAAKRDGEEEPAAGTKLAQGEEAIREVFTLDVLRFFAGHPSWHVESDGKHLALWRRSTILRAADRPGFLEDSLEVRRALTHPAARAEFVAVATGPGA